MPHHLPHSSHSLPGHHKLAPNQRPVRAGAVCLGPQGAGEHAQDGLLVPRRKGMYVRRHYGGGATVEHEWPARWAVLVTAIGEQLGPSVVTCRLSESNRQPSDQTKFFNPNHQVMVFTHNAIRTSTQKKGKYYSIHFCALNKINLAPPAVLKCVLIYFKRITDTYRACHVTFCIFYMSYKNNITIFLPGIVPELGLGLFPEHPGHPGRLTVPASTRRPSLRAPPSLAGPLLLHRVIVQGCSLTPCAALRKSSARRESLLNCALL